MLARPLPFELQEVIIGIIYRMKRPQEEERLLHPPTDKQKLITHTLRSCSLVCKDWFFVCRRFLMRDIRLCSMNHLEDIASHGYSAVGSPYTYIVNMTLSSLSSVANPRPFHHLVPQYLARKLPSLMALHIFGDEDTTHPRIFPVSKPFSWSLGQFRSLTKLGLFHLQFQSFWDLRRLVLSPPLLSSLTLGDVSWPSPFGDSFGVPSLITTPHRLSEVKISHVTRHWETLWFWTISCTPGPSFVVRSSSQEHTYPAFTTHDTIIIGQLIQQSLPLFDAPEALLSYCEDRLEWEISYRDSGKTGNEIRATVKALTCVKTPRAPLSQSPTRPESRVHWVHSLFCTTVLPPLDWKKIDGLCNSMQGLQEIHFSVSSSLRNRRGVIREISRSLPLLLARRDVSLSFIVDGAVVGNEDFANVIDEGDASNLDVEVSQREERNIIYDLFSDDYVRQLNASTEFRKLLSAEDRYSLIKRITEFGVVPRFVKFLHGGLPKIQLEAAAVLTNIALQVCVFVLSLRGDKSWEASGPLLSAETRQDRRMGEMIATFGLAAGTSTRHVAKVIELLEASRAFTWVWGQLHRLPAPLGDLETVSPVLAPCFQQSSKDLENRKGLLDANPEVEDDTDAFGKNMWKLDQVTNRIIEEMKTLPGFEKFLRRRSFEEAELCAVAKDGPVVIILDEGKALILDQDRRILVDLPLTYNTLRKLHRALRYEVDTHNKSDPAEESIYTDTTGGIHCSVEPLDPAENSRASRSGLVRLKSMPSLLEILWRQVVEPVLGEILGGRGYGKGELRAWEIPKLDDRQPIWWCCEGEFSSLPIHAAGIYRGSSPICLSDFFISSYTPTLTALLDARARPTSPHIKVLAVMQPNPGEGWSRLPQVKDELREIIQATPPSHLISLGDADRPDFEGRYTTVENVLEKLPEASILHFACHRTLDPTPALSSGFVLADGKKLTIEELIKCRLPNAHVAILSACHTASNDSQQSAINLSSALMFLGFSSILGTKGPMHDHDGPIIAKAVYQALFDTAQDPVNSQTATAPEAVPSSEHRPTLALFSLARVVDSVVRHMRVEKKMPADRWATFVHVGI